jgi:hypothetical protein
VDWTDEPMTDDQTTEFDHQAHELTSLCHQVTSCVPCGTPLILLASSTIGSCASGWSDCTEECLRYKIGKLSPCG